MPNENPPPAHARAIPFETYRQKVLGCWLGKAIGGTLGGPVEGKPGPLNLSYYDPVPEHMLPNDDLDLQVISLEMLRRHGPPVDRWLIAQGWRHHLNLLPDEYGVAVRNLEMGLMPPISGSYDNDFTAGMGGAIRSELWACLAPGKPNLALRLAREDACVDHDEEGVYAAEYLAALQSLAFVETRRERLLDAVSRLIPIDSRVSQAVEDTRRWWDEHGDWRKVRIQILNRYGCQNFTDVAQNLAFIILGWLAGETFGDAICIAVNCGEDTDCTGATLGALLGILDPGGIPDKWLEPIGWELHLSPGMIGVHHAVDLDQFTDQVAGAAQEILDFYHASGATIQLEDAPDDLPSLPPLRYRMKIPADAALLATGPLVVLLRYPDDVAIHPGDVRPFSLVVGNPGHEAIDVTLGLQVPDGWVVDPVGADLQLEAGQSDTLDLRIGAPAGDEQRRCWNPLDLHVELDGRRWTVTAGLVQTVPWLRDGEELIECKGRTIPLVDGSQRLSARFKLPTRRTIRLIVQAGGRSIETLVDGESRLAHSSNWHVPAIHRANDTCTDIRLEAGWHDIDIDVGEGDSDKLHLSLGDPETWELMSSLEWQRRDT